MGFSHDNSGGSDRVLVVSADLRRHYQVALTENLLGNNLHKLAECIGSRVTLLVTTPTVAKLYGSTLQRELKLRGISVPMMLIPCTENSKTLSQVEHICSQAYAHGLGRRSVLIGMGGGVCTDLVTMAASLFRRGIEYIRIPTTLIGQVDAGIGVKAAVNALHKKSAFGCFYPPQAVFLDPAFLRTLPLCHISGGLAEIIKVALVGDKRLFQLLEEHVPQLLESRFAFPKEKASTVLWRSVVKMLEELGSNLYERQGYKRLMDFGHTFSPLLEARSDFQLLHGEAVAIDMALTLVLANQLGFLSDIGRDRALSLIAASGLPITSELLTEELCVESFRQSTAHRGDALNLALPTDCDSVEFVERADEIPISRLRLSLTWLASTTRLGGRRFPVDAASTGTPVPRILDTCNLGK
jgi:3-dehydroquinate synthetase